jgi:hypothetical protein
MVTRRAFIGGSAAVAAGAVLRIGSDKTVRTTLAMYFFGPEPIMFDARLRTDPFSDLLVMEVLHEKGHVTAHLPLAAVKRALSEPGVPQRGEVRIWRDGILGQSVEESQIEICVQKELLTIKCPGDEPAPVWLPLGDVERAL